MQCLREVLFGICLIVGLFSTAQGAVYSSSTIEIEVSGLGAGEFDAIDLSEDAIFDSALIRVTFLGGFTPNFGDTFEILHATEVLGFETIRYEVVGLADDRQIKFSTDGANIQFIVGAAPGVTFRKVTDTNSPIPGGAGNFIGFNPVAMDGASVAFDMYTQGIYSDVGGTLHVVADRNTTIPGGIGNFYRIQDAQVDNDQIAFFGGNQTHDQTGIYLDRGLGGALEVVADRNTPIPGGSVNFKRFNSTLSLSGENVALTGSNVTGAGNKEHGVYIFSPGAVPIVVADHNTSVPGGTGSFTGLTRPNVDGLDVAFEGYSLGKQGIYTNIGGVLDVIADTDTVSPGGTGATFNQLVDAVLDDGQVVFTATASDGVPGVYTDINGTLHLVANGNTVMPGGASTFDFFLPAALDDGRLLIGGGKQHPLWYLFG